MPTLEVVSPAGHRSGNKLKETGNMTSSRTTNHVSTAFRVIAVLYSAALIFSAIGKLRLDPTQVLIIHERVGVPLSIFPLLAACEFAGAIGLLAGIRWRRLGIAAAIGLVIYFVGAILSHVRVGDFAGLGSPAFMLAIAVAALATRIKVQAGLRKRIPA
jgi:DoxX-like family